MVIVRAQLSEAARMLGDSEVGWFGFNGGSAAAAGAIAAFANLVTHLSASAAARGVQGARCVLRTLRVQLGERALHLCKPQANAPRRRLLQLLAQRLQRRSSGLR